jgi:adenine-specific DNA-methyltransferase
MNVFIGGSRVVSKLNATIRAKLDDFMKRGCTILIGDANGADKAVQQHFADHGYATVIVFCMAECRNNVGAWPTRNIEPPNDRKDFSYYAAKDLVMSQEAQCGVMLWDGKSKGTLQNMLNLIAAGKRTLVYFAPTKDLHVLANEQDLQTLLARCKKNDLDAASRGLRLKTPLTQPHLPMAMSGT